MMKKAFYEFRVFWIWVLISLIILPGCALLPMSKKVSVKRTPKKNTYIKLSDYCLKSEYPRPKTLWVAFSDRANNATTISRENEMPMKKLGLTEPVFILKKKNGYVKIAQYSPDIDLSAKSNKFDKKVIKSLGWIKKEHLLLWSAAMKDKQTNYFAKSISCITNGTIVKNATRFISGDSLVLFDAPELLKRNGKNIAPGTIVYVYKQSEDGKSILIGNKEYAAPENMKQNILGWISTDAISVWGTRAAFTITTDSLDSLAGIGLYSRKNDSLLLTPASFGNRSFFERVFPIQTRLKKGDTVLKTAFLDNVLDYSKNKVQNVLGAPVYYSKYKDIVKADQRANIIFVLDMSSNTRNDLPAATAFMQGLQLYFDTASLFRTYHYGAVVYKETHCKTDSLPDKYLLTTDYNKVVDFVEQKSALTNCEDYTLSQPVYKGLSDACSLLQPVKDESNIIVLVGAAGNDFSNDHTLNSVLDKIVAVNARLVLFQIHSKSSDSYNDFVLSAEKLVTNSASDLAEIVKNKIVDMKDVIADPGYNLVAGDSGVYFLDYPRRSMSQGIVLFPKKNETMHIGLLERYFDTMMHQVAYESRHINTSLRNYFRNVGIKYATVKPVYNVLIDSLPGELPVNFAKAFSDEQYSFLIPAYSKGRPFTAETQWPSYGVLLSENEYDHQVAQLYKIYHLTGGVEHFKKRRAYRKYKRYAKHVTASNGLHVKRKLKKMQLSEVTYLVSGCVSKDATNNAWTLRNLKKQPDRKVLIQYYNRYKQAADRLLESKNTGKVRIVTGEQPYFWIDEKWMP